ncbi:MAG TPA: DUF29 domain-containing protein [Azospirillaceae bacterium]|nr:DUF29 domain-containing protein [Azospirillaceae bacterium]HRQ80059.1 DUF29 domain-containing protein [Azospirillaceae bacterium]
MGGDSPCDFDRDYYAWTQDQARILRALTETMPDTPLDGQHLADEIEGLGLAERQRLFEALELSLVALLKLENSAARAPRQGWRNLLAVERRRVQRILRISPSLAFTPDLDELFQSARLIAAAELAREGGFDGALPSHTPYTLRQILDDGFVPDNRHGVAS